MVKSVYESPTSNTIFNDEKWKAFSLRSRITQEYPFPQFLFNTELKVLIGALKQEKEIKDIQIREKEVKLFLFTEDMILYVENPKVSTQKAC